MTAHIVVADDDADIRQLIAFTLRRRGYRVTDVADGDAALEAVRRESPDLVVLDAMMPGMSGLEVARELTGDAATVDIPIIIASARGQQYEVEEGLESGARDYLIKPFSPRELGERIAKLLEE